MSEFEEYRKAKDEFFRDDLRSPLTPDQRSAFNGLSYYPESTVLRIEVSSTPTWTATSRS
jgi:uncharacterized protein